MVDAVYCSVSIVSRVSSGSSESIVSIVYGGVVGVYIWICVLDYIVVLSPPRMVFFFWKDEDDDEYDEVGEMRCSTVCNARFQQIRILFLVHPQHQQSGG